MRLITIIIPAMVIAMSIAGATIANAKKRAVYCQGDHLHYGSSDSFKSKRQAFHDAVESWAGFTGFEYGSEWAHWQLSRNRSVKCGKSNGLWRCEIQSTPCRRAKRGEKRRFR